VEHCGVVAPLLVDRNGKGRVRRCADDLEAFRKPGDAVAVAHPDRILLADFPEAFEQWRGFENLDVGAAEFAVMAAFDAAADLGAQRLLAVADGENGNA
jgi:hypothetical protein